MLLGCMWVSVCAFVDRRLLSVATLRGVNNVRILNLFGLRLDN